MTDYLIRGQVISGDTRLPLANLRVEAWDKDLLFDDLLGSAMSDANGSFTIEFTPRFFRELVDRRPDIYFKVFRDKRLVADTRSQVLWNFKQPNVRVLIPVWGLDAPPAGHQEPFRVEGLVTTEGGHAVPDAIVEAWDQRLGTEKLLATGVTDAQGRYSMHYAPAELDGKKRADLFVRVLDPRQQRQELARSVVNYQASSSAVVSLTVLAASVVRLSEYERLLSATKPLLGKTPLQDLDAAGVEYVAHRSGWDARMVAMAAEAAHLSATTRIPASHYYALMRAGLQSDTSSMHRLPDTSVEQSLKLAIEKGVIANDQPIGATLQLYKQQSLSTLQNLSPPAAMSNLGDMLNLSLEPARKTAFLDAYRATAGQPTRLWITLADAGFDESTIASLKTNGKLGFLTRQNAPLVGRLRQIAKISRAEDLPRAGLYKAEAWKALIGQDVPKQISLDAYAAGLAAQVNLAYPTLVAAEMVRRNEIAVEKGVREGEGEIAAFLRSSHGKHSLGREPVKSWTGYSRLSQHGQDGVRLVERLHQLSPSNESMVALFNLGLHSAYQVTSEPKELFLQKHGDAFPSQTEAALVYQKAQEVHSTALNLATMYLSYRGTPNVYALTGSTLKEVPNLSNVPGTPKLEELLNNMDYCACEHCKSVLSPAAYFVDLLNFIDVADVPPKKKNPIEVLFARRPDLQHLLLSCENTNIALPHIDLVNEILEYFVVNGSLKKFEGYNMREDSKTADLLADPEVVTEKAYDNPSKAVYPYTLPFDMPLEALRLLMQAWDTALPAALRIFGTPHEARRETLGLNANEYNILTQIGFKALPEYFGEPAGATIDALNDAIADGKTFCRRTGISYQDLVDLLKTLFINPGAPLVPRLEALRVTLPQLQSWYNNTLDDAGLKALFPAGLDPAGYGGDILQWLRDNQALIMGLITLRDVSAEPVDCNFATVELRFALPDPAANRLTALAYHKLLRFIRMWKKFGWPIELTDRVVTTFLGKPSADLTTGTLDQEFTALIARIANFVWLMRRLSVTEKKISDWLAVWDATQTQELRRETLAHLLHIGATDLKTLSEMTGIDPLANDMHADSPSMHQFLDAWNALTSMKLKVVDADYVLRHRDDAGKLAPSQSDLLKELKILRDALTAVDADLSTPPDTADFAYAKSKMALVYDSTVVDWLVGLISANRTYEALFATVEETLPGKLSSVDARLAFDPFRKVLTYTGVMSVADQTALTNAADGLDLSDMSVIQQPSELAAFIAAFKTAVKALSDAGARDVQKLESEYPELKTVYDTAAAAPGPAAQGKAMVDAIVPALRSRLKTNSLRATLASLLKVDQPLVDVLTEGPSVLAANSDAAKGVLEDFLAIELPVTFDANQPYAFHLHPPATDDYIVYVSAPQGTQITLTIDGTDVIPATHVGAGGEVSTVTDVRLQAGMLPSATLKVASLPAGQAAGLSWRTKAMAKAPIPASRIYADARLTAARASLTRLQKAALLLRAMPLTPRELHYFAAVNPQTAGCLNGLNTGGAISAPDLHALWRKLAWVGWFSALKADEPDENTWVSLLENPELKTPQNQLMLAGTNGWKEEDLTETLKRLGLTLANLSSLEHFRKVKEAVDFIVATQQSAVDFLRWAVAAPDLNLIKELKQTLRARQDELSWRTTLQSVNDALRNKRRDALVSYILHHNPPAPSVDTANKLYEYFLIDVEMDACLQTSRIRQALSTVQLFITRCLMNLEPDVDASSIRADRWAWMKRYRVWEANRKIFLHPENWLEPELRDNKSPFFRDLESELLKADITDELAENAYLSYLKKLDEVARLEIMGCYLQEKALEKQEDDVLHVFGRTNGSTRQYYYRRYEYGYWTPWEKITLNIEGDHLFPVIWKNQLFVFWLTAAQKPEAGKPSETPELMSKLPWGSRATITVELGLSWGEYYRGAWTSPKSSELNQPMILTGLQTFEREKLVLSARTEKPSPEVSERLIFSVLYMASPAQAFQRTFTSKNSPPISKAGLDPKLLADIDLFNYYLLWEPEPKAVLDSNTLRQPGKTFKVKIQQPAGATAATLEETLLTKTSQLYDGFRVRPIMHPVQSQWEAPLFYSDELSVFFVSPDERVETVLEYDGFYWNDVPGVFIPPHDIWIPPVYEPPIIKDPKGPVINPNPLEAVVNQHYVQTISDNKIFVYRGTAFDARGSVTKEVIR